MNDLRGIWRASILWILTAQACWARLGGGGSYRSSSSGSSSSYSSSSSSTSTSGYTSTSSSGSGGGGNVLWFLSKTEVVVLIALVVLAGLILAIGTKTGHIYKTPRWFRATLVWAVGTGVLLPSWPMVAMLAVLVIPAVTVLKLKDYYEKNKRMPWTSWDRQSLGALLSPSRIGPSIRAMFLKAGDLVSPGDERNTAPKAPLELDRPDPAFSLPVFREFAILLYSQALRESCGDGFLHARPFLHEDAMAALRGRMGRASNIDGVVVGGFRLLAMNADPDSDNIRARFCTNYTRHDEDGEMKMAVTETWTFQRLRGVTTRVPKQGVAVLGCPGCGFTGAFPSDGVCPNCGKANVRGEFDWIVRYISGVKQTVLSPTISEHGGVEEGTTLSTVSVPDLPNRLSEFKRLHPEFDWHLFTEEAGVIFRRLQDAWSRRDSSLCRPHETDSLFRTHHYWIDRYRKEGRINLLTEVRVKRWEMVDLSVDAFYESITARVFASMIDVTTDEQGKVLFGDPDRPREFSEYWTFIRRVDHTERKGETILSCPSCGAPLDRIGQGGECGYCQSVVTTGEFGWVLSSIEQDEEFQLTLFSTSV